MYRCQYTNGATATIFVPYDCNNNCPFCVNKRDYKEKYKEKSLEKVIDSMCEIDSITPNCDFVFTGGEPFADIDALYEMLKLIVIFNCIKGHHHRIFINSTLPNFNEFETRMQAYHLLNVYKENITGINVSRHLLPYVKECNDFILTDIRQRFGINIRINTVVYNEKELTRLPAHLERFKDFDVQVREDYTKCTLENLNDLSTGILPRVLKEMGTTLDESNFLFRNDFRWNYLLQSRDNGTRVTIHRTLPYSTIKYGEDEEINDIIIEPNGRILTDWNDYGHELDLMEYEKCFAKG